MTDQQHEAEPGDRFAGARRFPSRLPPPSTGGGAELVELYGQPAGSWPAPADAPAPPPVVASGPGNRGPRWLLRGRRGEGDDGD